MRQVQEPTYLEEFPWTKWEEVSLDWLVGNTDTELNTNTLNRIQDIDKLNEKDKELIFEFLDSFISNRKIKKVLT